MIDINSSKEVLTSVTWNGEDLKHASKEFRGNKEVVLVAVASNGTALFWASKELKDDRGGCISGCG